MTCDECRYFAPRDGDIPDLGECRRYAPRPITTMDIAKFDACWPDVLIDEWCGEFERKSKE